MTEQESVLVRVLAAIDALWKPMRLADWTAPMPTILYEGREKFAAEGLPWHSEAATEAGRKADQRTLESLASAGLVKLQGKERRTAARLTEKGDAVARALVGQPNVDATHFLIGEVLRLESSGGGFPPMCSELWPAGLRDYADTDHCRRKLLAVQDEALPALCRGWLATESDCHGRVWYLATALGRRVAKKAVPKLPPDLPPMDDAVCDLYDKEVVTFRERLRHAEPKNERELGYIPLPASIDIRPRAARKARRKESSP